jgi:hypothetical protein
LPSLYHAVPDPLVGSVLYPLNELEQRAPEAWRRAHAKYDWRPEVLQVRIPPLDCLWNDVLHFSPVPPVKIVAALEAAGLEPLRRRFFVVDAAELEPARTVIFRNARERVADRIDDEQWLPFDPALLPELSRLTEPTIGYYRECASSGTRPLLYGYLPHVLYRGSLETRGIPVAEV